MENIKNIAAALIKAQQEMSNAIKDANNPFFKSKYADLNAVREACMPALHLNKITVLQPTIQKDNKNYVRTILLHESGESIECDTEIIFSKPNDAQAQGSGITYARRYGLQSLICIGAEDDDGNKASVEEEWKDSKEGKKYISDNFKSIKEQLESCEDLEDLKKIWKDNSIAIARLKKYVINLYDILLESKEAMKLSFELNPPQ